MSEDLDTLWNALYTALEADLSGLKWPKGSQAELKEISDRMDNLITIAEEK